jgi:hypothetical protein
MIAFFKRIFFDKAKAPESYFNVKKLTEIKNTF